MLSQESIGKATSTSKSLDDVEIEIVIDTETHKTSIFALYAKIFRLLLTAQIPNFSLLSEDLRNKELEKLILPSDEEWRHRVYHSLVELQREKDAEPTQDKKENHTRIFCLRTEDSKRRMTRKNSQDWEWRPRGSRSPREKGHLPKGRRDESKNIVGSSNNISETGADGSMTEARIEPGWRINDILLAAKVLQNARPSPNYANEAEMRRVFGLVYDVLRYKNILNRTLEDGGFWYRNNALKQQERVVWLLLYDMQGRKFAHRRGSACETREKVFEERSLCLGAATLAQAIRVARLCGPVVLTHSIAPRHTGYLAGLLADIEDAGRLLAFDVGDRRCEYEAYLTNLGVTLQQCTMFSEKYISSPSSVELERATVVLATPPCSYTGVRDIVDLAVARGGDINLLESLTSDTAGGVKQPHVLLAEQFSTLKYALTRPNIQFLIYEVHTILPSETTEMIHQVVEYANQLAMEKYIREHLVNGKIPKSIKTDVHRQEQSREHWEDQSQHEQMFFCKREDEEYEKLLDTTDIVIPDSDLFEVGTIDEIYGETNEHMLDPGCFIAVIKRKEMMQFDSLFMIKVAESKGLFGDPDKQRNPKQKAEIPSATRQTLQISRRGFKRIKVEIDRVAAPTHAWMLRAKNKRQPCPRHSRHIVRDEKLLSMQIRETRKRDARRWWRDAITFLVDSKSHQDSMKDSQFYATRSDPFTQKPLYPFHAKKMPLKCHRHPQQRNLAFDSIFI
ncbi:hypothetical protein G5I_04149 [Acromyrmex echinatior]|uniref:Methyltransferase NSUN7 n=1 Tax=Acromyrmex echinatior TaxID=103372 RepID=F4WEV0_ACREC|nr:hypothetical protein G5I_04149 [Acromyrmex echinatior]